MTRFAVAFILLVLCCVVLRAFLENERTSPSDADTAEHSSLYSPLEVFSQSYTRRGNILKVLLAATMVALLALMGYAVFFT